MTFSIIVVCLNAGEKLHKTIDSILQQTEQDYEIVVKDGGSRDNSLQQLPTDERIHIYEEKDMGIYDAMNQAVCHAAGDYIFFLNCGDYFYDAGVLEQVKAQIMAAGKTEKAIFYGNICENLTGAMVASNPVINDFACYRNVPCHQACFYDRSLFDKRGFSLNYRVRADYEHFLWCFYEAGAVTHYMPITVALYEGGGFSETKENEKLSVREHREIVAKYMPPAKVRKYRWIMCLSLAGVRTKIARNPVTAKLYNEIKKRWYGQRKQ